MLLIFCKAFLIENQYANLIISKVMDVIIIKFVKNMTRILIQNRIKKQINITA